MWNAFPYRSLYSHNPLPDSISNCGSTPWDIELDKNIAQVTIDCARTYHQYLGDLAVCMPFSYQAQHFQFPPREVKYESVACFPLLYVGDRYRTA